MNKKKFVLIASLLLTIVMMVATAIACSGYFFTLPTNGIGFWSKQKEPSVITIENITEHITCANGMLHIEFDLRNTDDKVSNVELWVYFKDKSDVTIVQNYLNIGSMAKHEVKHISFDQYFGSLDQLNKFDHEDFSIHYVR